jgi:ABC-type uncharacterized transport system involved in gliding motility auxiliary subunit
MVSKRGYDYRRTLLSVTGLVVLLVILILLNVIFSHANIRWDTTEDKIYSLSDGTHKILAGMERPVTIKFFYSRSNRNFPNNLKLYAKRVREFLMEYERTSRGKVKVELYDPKPDSDEEEWAQKYGIQPMQLPTGEDIYCGLAFLAEDQEETIPVLDPSRESLIEYDVTRLIQRLQTFEQTVIGLISSLPITGFPTGMGIPRQPMFGEPWLFVEELRKTYDVQDVDTTAGTIDPAVDLLLIIHPKALSPKMQYAIDQYILRGGNAAVYVDPFCVSDRSQGQQRFTTPSSTSMEKLLGAWGVSVDMKKTVADMDQPTRLRTGQNQIQENPIWISARGAAFNSDEVITAQLESMLFPVAGAIEKKGDSSYEFVPLVQSGRNAALVDTFKVNLGVDSIRRDFVPAGEQFNIAVQVRGLFKTAFPAGPPKEEDKEEASKEKEEGSKAEEKEDVEHLEVARESATIIIIGDADLLADNYYVRKGNFLGFDVSQVFNDNLNLLSNACEILTGGDELIGLRSRGMFDRPFTAVLALERRAQERWLAKENELVRRAEDANRKLRELQQQKDASQKLILSPEQEAEISKFRAEKRRIDRELKEVRKNLRADIETLGVTLKGINIFLMPLLVSAAGLGFAIYRQRRMRTK